MRSETQRERRSEQPLTPEKVVLYGTLMVNLPVPIIMALGMLLGFLVDRESGAGAILGGLVGFVAAWVWWSFTAATRRKRAGSPCLAARPYIREDRILSPQKILIAISNRVSYLPDSRAALVDRRQPL
jgi:hypothetical protein